MAKTKYNIKFNTSLVNDKTVEKRINELSKSPRIVKIRVEADNFETLKRKFEELNNSIQSTTSAVIQLNEIQNKIDSGMVSMPGINAQNTALNSLSEQVKQVTLEINNLTKANKELDENKAFEKQANQLEKFQTKLDKIQIEHADIISQSEILQRQFESTRATVERFGETGEGSVREINSQIVQLSKNVRDVERDAKKSQQFLLGSLNKITTGIIGAEIFNKIGQSIRDMIDQVKNLDASLVEIQKVSDLTGQSLERFKDKAFEVGQQVGRTGQEVIDAAAEFKRSGYTIEESLNLAEQANIMLNVADGMNQTSQAAAVLISTMKAYNLTVEDSVRINDIFNEVSNKSAISFDDIAEGVRRSSGVYAQAGTSLEELTGLLTATNEIMQDIEKTSSGLNTISLRLRGIKEIGDESAPTIAKLQGSFKELAGVDILDPITGQLRDTYDILYDTASVWKTLDENTKQFLSELAAGKRQVNVFNSLMMNFSKSIEAVKYAQDSANSAQEENARFLDSVQGKLNNLSSAWQTFSDNTINSGFVKWVIDFTTGVIKAADSIGALNIAFGVLASYFLAKGNKGIVDGVKSLISATKDLTKETNLVSFAMELFGLKSTETAVETTAAGAAATSAAKGFTILKAALGGVVVTIGLLLFQKVVDFFKDMFTQASQLTEEISGLNSEISKLQSELDSLNDKGSRNWTEEEQQRVQMLEREIELLKERELLLERERANLTKKSFTDSGERTLSVKMDDDSTVIIGNVQEDIEKLKNSIDELNEQKIKLLEEKDFEGVQEINEELLEMQSNLNDLEMIEIDVVKQLQEDLDKGLLDADKVSLAEQVIAIYNDRLRETANETETLVQSQNKANIEFDSFSTIVSNLKNEIDPLTQAYQEYINTGQLGLNTVLELIMKGDEYLDYLILENGQYTLNANAVEMYFEKVKAAKINELKLKQETMKADAMAYKDALEQAKGELEAMRNLDQTSKDTAWNIYQVALQLGESLGYEGQALKNYAQQMRDVANDGIGAIMDEISKWESKIAEYDAIGEQIKFLESLTLPDFTQALDKTNTAQKAAAKSAKEVSKAEKEMKDAIKEAEKAVKDAEDALDDYMGAIKDTVDQITGAIDDEIDALEKQNDALEEMGDRFNAFGDIIIDSLKDEMDAIDKAAQAEKDRIQAKLDALEEEEKLNDRNKKLEEARLEIAKAKDELERAKRQNVKIYRKGASDFVYEVDTDAVEQAQGNLEDAQNAYDDLVDEYEKEDIKDALKDEMDRVDADTQAKKDSIQSQIDDLQDLMDAWGDSTEKIKQDILAQKDAQEWLSDFQNATAEERLEMLENLDNAYSDLVESELEKNNQRIEDLENLRDEFESDYEDLQNSLNEYQLSEQELNEFLKLSIEDRKAWLKDLTSTWKSEISSMIAEINRLKAAMESLEGASVGSGGGGSSSSSGSSGGKWGGLNGNSQLSKDETDIVNKFNPVDNPELADKAGEIWDAIHTGNKSEAVQNAIDKAQGKKNKKSYAKGGTRVVDYTGWEKGMANTWVDGTPLKPEVVLNNTDAKKLYDLVKNTPESIDRNSLNPINININDISLPNVNNGEQFVDEIKNMAMNYAVQMSKDRK